MAKIPASSKAAMDALMNGLSFYTMRGVDKVIIRRKGGPKKSAMRKSPKFTKVRYSQSEFKIRARSVRYVRTAMIYQKLFADYNFAGPLNALMRKVQVLDKVNDLGQRGVFLSRHKEVLTGFSLNKNNIFDAVVRYPVKAEINREGLSALVHIPAIIPGVNFFSQNKYAYYRFRVTLGVIPDVSWSKHGPVVRDNSNNAHPHGMRDTVWFPVKKGSPEMEIGIRLDGKVLADDCTMMLTIGVCYGVVQDKDDIVQAPRAGCAKVLEVG